MAAYVSLAALLGYTILHWLLGNLTNGAVLIASDGQTYFSSDCLAQAGSWCGNPIHELKRAVAGMATVNPIQWIVSMWAIVRSAFRLLILDYYILSGPMGVMVQALGVCALFGVIVAFAASVRRGS